MHQARTLSHGDTNRPLADRHEPIAIVGMGCRFPGGSNSLDDYWRLLENGLDAIQEIDSQRWDHDRFYDPTPRPGKTQSRWAGLVDEIDQFDPQLFGISPREASRMDPQQRMLLEVAWRAIEDAGQPHERLAGQPVSVFVGISSWDYALAGLSFADRGVIDAYNNTGGSFSIAANRISYCFDLRGPSVAVDTACSSSLVAVHMACESLWRGQATLALAGGVNALLMPDFFVAFSQLGVLSPDGRCKTFDASANGYVRSEGAGMVVLKPLSVAQREGDRIYAVVRGSTLNQDGRTPGLTVPNQRSQQQLVETACRNAAVRPRDIQYVEAHGTGTPVGDPIEASALADVLSVDRPIEQPCWIGSVKTNIGHLEAGAGIASVIKVALAIHHGRIPAHLHFTTPNPKIDFQRMGLRVPTQTIDWPTDGQLRTAGINGFGYGGANAHLILQQSPTCLESADAHDTTNSPQQTTPRKAGPQMLVVSAKSREALIRSIEDLRDWLDRVGKQHPLHAIASTMAYRRSHWEHRIAICGSGHEEWLAELESQAKQLENLSAHSASKQADRGVVFACSGQGPQWWGMGRQLIHNSVTFRKRIEACDAEFFRLGNWSLMDELLREESTSRIQKTSIAQPALFAMQIGLAAVWESFGVVPDVLVGHSVGEIAAAHLAGALTWEDACLVAFHRGRTMDQVTSLGKMLAVGLSMQEIGPWLRESEGAVVVSAMNGPNSLTLSGTAEAVDQLAVKLRNEGLFCRALNVEYAFHSPQMEPVREPLLESLASITPQSPKIPFYSTVTGHPLSGELLDAEYWWRNVRQPVRFADCMGRIARNWNLFVELGPHPVLAYAINECYAALEQSVQTIASLHREVEDETAMLHAAGCLYTLGHPLNWEAIVDRTQEPIRVPEYPFQKQRCWNESLESRQSRMNPESHPLVGKSVCGPLPAWEARIDLRLQTYLADHRVRNVCVLPAASLLESAIWIAGQIYQSTAVRIEHFRLHHACVLSEDRPKWLHYSFEPQRRLLQVAFRDADQEHWTPLASMQLADATTCLQTPLDSLVSVRQRCSTAVTAEDCYEYCYRLGLEYGPQFRGLLGGGKTVGESLVNLTLPEGLAQESAAYRIHPALLDSCFHAMVVADPKFSQQRGELYLPSQIQELRFYRQPQPHVQVHAKIVSKSEQRLLANIDVFNRDGTLAISLRGFESLRMWGQNDESQLEDMIYSQGWEPAAPLDSAVPESVPVQTAENTRVTDGSIEDLHSSRVAIDTHWIILSASNSFANQLCERLANAGDSVQMIDPLSVDGLEDISQQLRGEFERHPHSRFRLLYLVGLAAPPNDRLDAETLDDSTTWQTMILMHLVQAWEQVEANRRADLFIITQGAQCHEDLLQPIALAQTPLIGFGRVIVNEYAPWQTRLVDLPRDDAPSDDTNSALHCLIRELQVEDEEDEVMWRDGKRYVYRFRPHFSKTLPRSLTENCRYQLPIHKSSSIDQLCYVMQPKRLLREDEIEIEVQAAALNFSDVMKALDLYPGHREDDLILGAECAGTISRVGAQVRQWSVGDRVMAVAPGAFGSHVVVPSTLVARVPHGLTFIEAAGIPIAFLTAEYALNECARIRPDDSVLVHAASGGVGMAALQIVRENGARALASAGNAEKRKLAKELGAEHVVNSRSLGFDDELMKVTNGSGVDVILNSLPGEAIARGLGILKPGGRFLEIGKRDIYGDTPLAMLPFRNNLAFFGIDLDQLFQQQPQKMGRLLESIGQRMATGQLQPLQHRVFPSHQTVDAFRLMQQGKHVGKIIVEYTKRPEEIFPAEQPPLELSSDATYWIVGGLGGFGWEIAQWLARRGAKTLVLTSRRTTVSSTAQQDIDRLRQTGVAVHLLPADITSVEEVNSVRQKIQQQLPPLRGVFHSAMVLQDRLLVDLDQATLQNVLRPKVLGGWNLHQATADIPLDHFVLFSSLSSIFGHAGQANYAAANAFLDGLARHRRALGLPALVINWGRLGEVGYLAQRAALGERLERQGVLSFSVRQATECLSYAMSADEFQMSVLRMDWSVWRGLGTSRVSPRFAHLLRGVSGPSGTGNNSALSMSLDELRHASPADCALHFQLQVAAKISHLLGIPAERINCTSPLLELGLDSLMAVELRNWIQSHYGLNLPIASLMRSASLQGVAEVMAEEWSGAETTISPASPSELKTKSTAGVSLEQAWSLLEEIHELSETEVDYWLDRLIAENASP